MSDYYDDEYVEFADEDESDEQGFIEEEGEDIPDDLDEADAAEEPDGPDEAARPAGQRQPKWSKLRTRRLFRAARAGDAQAREQLIMAYRGLARNIARKYRDRDEGIPFEDLEQVAYLGLIKAIDRFEPERGFEFSTFATPTITGELRRYFRDKGWSVRVPRRLQDLSQKVKGATDDLAVQLGHTPSVSELAEYLGASVDDVLEAMEASSAYSSVSFEKTSNPDDEDALTLMDSLGDEDRDLTGTDDRLLLDEAISSFSP
ncbi:MAG: sigma-70 family RNA polymerase sigma factor, partial [Atopobiaceae bacterium]|nr:sigma-70 family RNA polymerase sigma factor [Atopobiaceae bacterium]